ncbi:MAG: PmeII family type II restriction endonuclease [Oculatellaceae cyanobacterium bins.114]|nr:PmeII family type II restriction endonuclease [Oculatellaceae cyanobacterium bins.114]
MNADQLRLICDYVNQNIDQFYINRLKKIKELKLSDILKSKNPYLLNVKNLNSALELIPSILDARLSSSEEGQFGAFLEGLAIYVSELMCSGQKSSANGLDLEFNRDGIRYIVAVKSGTNWGNSGQQNDLREAFKRAVKIIKQSSNSPPVQPVLGICYGKVRTTNNGLFIKIAGQSFWHFISGDARLYIDLIEPLGFEAKKHNEDYLKEKDNTYNRFVREFTVEFCQPSGEIDWSKLVEFTCGNLRAAELEVQDSTQPVKTQSRKRKVK